MAWKWIWPTVGGSPINQGLDSEMFDRDDYPYSETFVREAIQNSLDARLDTTKPVTIRFRFHEARLGKREKYLKEAMTFRDEAKLTLPSRWTSDKISWITIEDFNARGLQGDLAKRTSDFWNYWLNFGISNKDGTGRGGRGIGRVTFLIASKVHTVLGITRRHADRQIAACGMCVLKAGDYQGKFLSTHAYLAETEKESIYDLHTSQEFLAGLEEAFELSGYTVDPENTGLSLIIPYPHEELTTDGILGAAIQHFAPAILGGSLVVQVDEYTLDQTSIRELAPYVADDINSEPIAKGVERYLALIAKGLSEEPIKLHIQGSKATFSEDKESEIATALQAALGKGDTIAIRITLPLKRWNKTQDVSLVAVLAETPFGKPSIDRLFREGMSLPDVKARNTRELDLITLVDDPLLATYLNFCEGKAHLNLLESKETKAKLEENGFDGFQVKRLVKSLPDELRGYLTPDITQPDATVFDSFFSIADEGSGKARAGGAKKILPPTPPPPPPQPRISAIVVHQVADGFRLRANNEYPSFPTSVEVTIAYADGSRKPSWSEFDFRPSQLKLSKENCEAEFHDNRLKIKGWAKDSSIEVRGFDPRRELDTRMRVTQDASEN